MLVYKNISVHKTEVYGTCFSLAASLRHRKLYDRRSNRKVQLYTRPTPSVSVRKHDLNLRPAMKDVHVYKNTVKAARIFLVLHKVDKHTQHYRCLLSPFSFSFASSGPFPFS